MPAQRPATSEQVVCTPDDLLDAFEKRFGPIVWDLAATLENRVRAVPYFGPGSWHGEDALEQDWNAAGATGNLWLNPEFGQIAKFARKALESGAAVNMFVPLSSSNWARDYCWGKAMIYPLNPRVTFKNHLAPFPKDCMLVRYGLGYFGCDLWNWKGGR